MKEKKEIFINLDDSGKLTCNEQISVYAGLVFLSKKEKDKFITVYRSIVKDIRCNYCHNNNCNNKCPEIKNTNIRAKDKRRLMNYMKKYYSIALVINNDNVYNHIKTNKAAKGRYIDYSIRRMIKECIKNLIINNEINQNKPLKIIINIDEQTTKSNGYYNLHDGLIEELKYGIANYNYGITLIPIINNDLNISIAYQNSAKSYVVQAADLLAGTVRRNSIDAINSKTSVNDSLKSFINCFIILP